MCRCVRLGRRTCTSPYPGSQATRGKKLDLSHFLCFTSQTRSREAGRRVCQRTATQQDAGGVLRQSGRRVRECVAVYRRTPGVFRAIRAAGMHHFLLLLSSLRSLLFHRFTSSFSRTLSMEGLLSHIFSFVPIFPFPSHRFNSSSVTSPKCRNLLSSKAKVNDKEITDKKDE